MKTFLSFLLSLAFSCKKSKTPVRRCALGGTTKRPVEHALEMNGSKMLGINHSTQKINMIFFYAQGYARCADRLFKFEFGEASSERVAENIRKT